MKMTYRHNCELHFIWDVQLGLFQYFTEVKEHPGISIYTLNEAKAIAYSCNDPLEQDLVTEYLIHLNIISYLF